MLRSVEIELVVQFSPSFANTFSVTCNAIKKNRINEENINYYDIFLTIFSCKKSENSENQISENEKSVLLRKISAKIIKPAFGGKMFGDLIVLQRDPSEIYVWTTLQEFYGENNVELGTGTSLPLRINLNGNPITEDNIVNIEKPGDGSLYGEDIKKLFPENLQKKIENLPSSKVLMQMTEDVKNHPIK